MQESPQLLDPSKLPQNHDLHLVTDKRYWQLYERGVYFALIVHTLFIFFFYFLGANTLAAFNLGSVGVYLYCLRLIRRGNKNTVIILCWLEILGHAALAVRTLGWDSGFHYYLLVIIPLIFASSNRKFIYITFMTALVCGIYIFIDFTMRSATPYIFVNESILSVMRYANIVTTYAFLGYIAYIYVNTISIAEGKLFSIATRDELTGLHNRRYLMDVMEHEYARYKRDSRIFSLIIADIDDFKPINDNFGHELGDKVLTEMGEIFRREVRAKDSVARWGGEEFLILLPNTGVEEALLIAERIRKVISDTNITPLQSKLNVTITMGVSEIRPHETVVTCISRADNALYEGKRAGKDRTEEAA